MSMTHPADPPSREQLLYWLHEAAEIEHHLMCCYLYAAFSLKRVEPAWSTEQREAVARWRETIMSVVYEEMAHLALVGNLANALGGSPHMGRPPFPIDAGPYPAGFVIRLQAFSLETIEHFKFLERPLSEDLSDAENFAAQRQYKRVVPEGRLSPGARDYDTVGELYQVLAQSLDACVAADGQVSLFIGDPRLQIDATLAPLQGVVAVTDLQSAHQAIETIVTQGEGAGGEETDSHFCRFTRIGDELKALLAADPSFTPAWPAATNPVMNAPVHSSSERTHISEPRIARWLDIANAMYTTSLRCLLQGITVRERVAKATWLAASFSLMRALVPVGQGLASRPATKDPNGPHAGLTFTPLRTLARLQDDGAAAFVAERLGQLCRRASTLPIELVAGESAATWQGVIDLLGAQQAALLALAGLKENTLPEPVPERPVAAPAAADSESEIEIAKGVAVTVVFEGKRCIHSRHCVLDAPSVFLANTPGEWIHPDTVSAETLISVAHNCPSGAIHYQRQDGGTNEKAPAVNQLHIRENGPYAARAALRIGGREDGFRATLCRCGASNNKPWCDSSHVRIGFVASGEPKSGNVEPLAVRDGVLDILPLINGPLRVRGNLEICSGTGRTVARITEAKLCRCGHSKSKPFCDLSHVTARFIAEGS